MKLEEFDSLVKDGQVNTESILKIRDAISDMNSTIDTLNNDMQTKDNRIKELQETNGKLYLRVTGGSTSSDGQDNIPSLDDIIKNWEVK